MRNRKGFILVAQMLAPVINTDYSCRNSSGLSPDSLARECRCCHCQRNDFTYPRFQIKCKGRIYFNNCKILFDLFAWKAEKRMAVMKYDSSGTSVYDVCCWKTLNVLVSSEASCCDAHFCIFSERTNLFVFRKSVTFLWKLRNFPIESR